MDRIEHAGNFTGKPDGSGGNLRNRRDHVFGNAEEVYLDLRQADNPEHRYDRYAPGLNHMGFTAPDRKAIEAVQKAMAEAGFEVAEIQEFGDGSALFLKDREGMRIEVASYN